MEKSQKESRGRLGTCFYTVLHRPGQKPVNASFHLRFSSAFDLQEEEWEDTIIHELIHYYLAFFDMNDKTSHGENFKRMMKDINARFGRHVSISYKPPKNGEDVPKYRFAIVRDRRGQTGIKRLVRAHTLTSCIVWKKDAVKVRSRYMRVTILSSVSLVSMTACHVC